MSAAPRITGGAGRERRMVLARFGGEAELRVQPELGQSGQAQQRMDRAAALLTEFDERLSRFDSRSELCRLNADPRASVPASPLMLRFIEAVGWAGRTSGGLVDATLLPDVERAGYVGHLELPPRGAPGEGSLADGRGLLTAVGAALHVLASDEAQRAMPKSGGWRDIAARPGHVERPVGVRLDSGGIGKGLAADLAAELLRGAPAWVVDCGGDLRIGGTARVARPVDIADPLDPARVLHRLHVTSGAVATSGVTRRAWGPGDHRRHHLIDPRTGEPSSTGVLQVTALAPTALEAEVLAKTALLSGPERAHGRLPHGGVIVCENGLVMAVPPPKVEQAPRHGRRRAAFQMPGKPTVLRVLDGAR